MGAVNANIYEYCAFASSPPHSISLHTYQDSYFHPFSVLLFSSFSSPLPYYQFCLSLLCFLLFTFPIFALLQVSKCPSLPCPSLLCSALLCPALIGLVLLGSVLLCSAQPGLARHCSLMAYHQVITLVLFALITLYQTYYL